MWSVFLPSVVGLKGLKARVFKAFLVFGRRLSGVLLPKNEYKKDTLQNTECLIVFNLFPYSYKAVGREQKILYFRSKLGLSYNNMTKLVGHVGQQSDLTSTLDSSVELALVLCASAGNAAGQDLAALADELAELGGVLIIDEINLVRTEDADLLSLAVHGACGTHGVLGSIHNDKFLL